MNVAMTWLGSGTPMVAASGKTLTSIGDCATAAAPPGALMIAGAAPTSRSVKAVWNGAPAGLALA